MYGGIHSSFDDLLQSISVLRVRYTLNALTNRILNFHSNFCMTDSAIILAKHFAPVNFSNQHVYLGTIRSIMLTPAVFNNTACLSTIGESHLIICRMQFDLASAEADQYSGRFPLLTKNTDIIGKKYQSINYILLFVQANILQTILASTYGALANTRSSLFID